ncbi:response regulator [Sphingomonas ginkgonis]|uniref:Response regulator n=1 Tax=Sphingomonas ginkgonis TaxID=2315330 RepID=A0A429VBE1_9SPHN|nr:response regulator [Sphingomonas ginkgonis]RST31300.1 response regulator [Sphingomonas ginkgonis]
MNDTQAGKLTGRRVLVVEDEFYLADDLRRELIDQGAKVAGPVNTVDRARALTSQPIDLAVLDVNLRGEMIFPLADELRKRGVPFVFTTGYAPEMIPAEYHDVERWEKPFTARQIVQALAKL